MDLCIIRDFCTTGDEGMGPGRIRDASEYSEFLVTNSTHLFAQPRFGLKFEAPRTAAKIGIPADLNLITSAERTQSRHPAASRA